MFKLARLGDLDARARRDITLRALETLAAADVIACEDSRVTRKLLDHYGITAPLTPYHEHNAAAARPKLLARLGHSPDRQCLRVGHEAQVRQPEDTQVAR